MITLADVRRWDHTQVEAAFTQLGALRDGLANAEYDFGRARVPDDRTGLAADGARASQTRLTDRMRQVNEAVTTVIPPVGTAADQIQALRRDLSAVDDLAAATGFAIGPDGTVRDVRQTVIAALTTGLALQHEGAHVDDAIFLGSPGIGTNHVTDLGVPPGHTFVAEASGDPVADSGYSGTDPNHLDGVTDLATGDAVDLDHATANTTGLGED